MAKQSDHQEVKEYEKVNECSRRVSKVQVLAISLSTVTLALGLSLIPSILKDRQPILYVLLAFDYTFLAFALFDYLVLILLDPADPRLKDRTFKRKKQKLQFCKECSTSVDIVSFHCRICNRCVEQLDHHYPLLNNCVGKQNYRYFLKFLLEVDVHTGINLAIGVWLVLNRQGAFRWTALVYSLLNLVVFVEILWLAAYQFYISVVLKKTTLEVMRKGSSNKIYPMDRPLHLNEQWLRHRMSTDGGRIEINSNGSSWGEPITHNPLECEKLGL